MHLWLKPEQALQIQAEAVRVFPQELCGLVFGTGAEVRTITFIRNVAPNPLTGYQLEEHAYVEAMFKADEDGQTLLAILHSHPNTLPVPSMTDITQAVYADVLYLIVGLQNPDAPRFGLWAIAHGEAEPAALHIDDLPPDLTLVGKLSPGAKTAIILSTIIAFLMVLALAVMLLPPAPVLPN